MNDIKFFLLLIVAATAGVLNKKAGGSFWSVYLIGAVILFAAEEVIKEVKKRRV
ncbi:MAG: hypothetical protein AAB864_01675 [Patescibacteria group bacterium]